MKRYYPAIIEKNPAAAKAKGKGMRGLFGVIFPDVEGCYSAGDTIDEAIRNAEEALKLHLEGMTEDGQKLPDASSPEDAVAKSDVQEGDIAVVAMIGAALPPASVRLAITMDQDLVDEIDAVTANRSAFLAEASRAELARRRTTSKIPVYAMSSIEGTKKIREQR